MSKLIGLPHVAANYNPNEALDLTPIVFTEKERWLFSTTHSAYLRKASVSEEARRRGAAAKKRFNDAGIGACIDSETADQAKEMMHEMQKRFYPERSEQAIPAYQELYTRVCKRAMKFPFCYQGPGAWHLKGFFWSDWTPKIVLHVDLRGFALTDLVSKDLKTELEFDCGGALNQKFARKEALALIGVWWERPTQQEQEYYANLTKSLLAVWPQVEAARAAKEAQEGCRVWYPKLH